MVKIFMLGMSLFLAGQTTFSAPAQSVSLYGAGLGEWTDDAGKKVKLTELSGKKVVVAMVYTSCELSCPLIVKKLKKLDLKLQGQGVTAAFVVVSFDSKFDTPAKLALFRKHQEITDPRWRLLVGSEKDTRFLSNLLEIRFSRNPKDLTISHDNKIVLLNEKGEIVKSLEGLALEPDEKCY